VFGADPQVWRNVGETGSDEPGPRVALRARSNDVDLILGLPYGPAAHSRRTRGRTHGSSRLRDRAILKFFLHRGGAFSNRASLVNWVFGCCGRRTGITVLSAVGRIRRNVWFEAQALQCPQRAHMVFMRLKALARSSPAPSPRRATLTSGLLSGCSSTSLSCGLNVLLL
jgi:hypothetical protein